MFSSGGLVIYVGQAQMPLFSTATDPDMNNQYSLRFMVHPTKSRLINESRSSHDIDCM